MGATHVRFVLTDGNTSILNETQELVNVQTGAAGVIAQMRDGIGRIVPHIAELKGISIGVPGGVDPTTGIAFDLTNVPGWRDVDMGGELEEEFHVPVFLDNDANMAAIGEHMRG